MHSGADTYIDSKTCRDQKLGIHISRCEAARRMPYSPLTIASELPLQVGMKVAAPHVLPSTDRCHGQALTASLSQRRIAQPSDSLKILQ